MKQKYFLIYFCLRHDQRLALILTDIHQPLASAQVRNLLQQKWDWDLNPGFQVASGIKNEIDNALTEKFLVGTSFYTKKSHKCK